jgi:cytochrome c biogenesis protein CcmG/thiol:disulfide interchange protein DsbE
MASVHPETNAAAASRPKAWRRSLFLLPILVFAGIGVFLTIGLWQDPEKLPSTLIDKPAPIFALPPLPGRDDGGLSTADLGKGGVMLVNVFASWCIPCKVEHPVLMRLASQGITIVGINYKDKPEDAARFLSEFGSPYRKIGVDRDGRAAIEWGVYGVPETFIVDQQGHIVYRQVGPMQERELDEKILPILEKLKG